MRSKVALYETHEKAIEALKSLKKNEFPMSQVSLLGQAEIIEDHLHFKSTENIKNAPLLIGAGAGTLIGLLSGLGTFVIPGFGILYGAGAIVGAAAGFDFGIITGGIATFLATIGIKKDQQLKIDKHINEGKFFIVVNGDKETIKKADEILHKHGTHKELF